MDRRQAKTRKAILRAFSELLCEKSAEKITVTEISELADIGKSTFYTHFETKDHLVEDVCKHFFEHLKESENTELFPNLEQALLHMLWHIYDEDSDVLKLIKYENRVCDGFFVEYLEDIFIKHLSADKEINSVFALNHVVESFITALRWHICNPNMLTLEELVRDFLRFNKSLL